MTKDEMLDALAFVRTQHPVHAMPQMLKIVAELIARLPDEVQAAKPRQREHVHKRFVPLDVTIPDKEPV